MLMISSSLVLLLIPEYEISPHSTSRIDRFSYKNQNLLLALLEKTTIYFTIDFTIYQLCCESLIATSTLYFLDFYIIALSILLNLSSVSSISNQWGEGGGTRYLKYFRRTLTLTQVQYHAGGTYHGHVIVSCYPLLVSYHSRPSKITGRTECILLYCHHGIIFILHHFTSLLVIIILLSKCGCRWSSL